jgi:branched-chain amino acid transport system substrate-binding protein
MALPSGATSRRRVRAAASALAASALLLAGCAESDTKSDANPAGPANSGPIKIGAVLDITGAGASLGVPERRTIELLAKQLNAKGGINGRKVELIVEDNQSTEDGAAKAMTKLVDRDKVDVVLGASRTGPSLAMRPKAEASKVPMISLAANKKIVDGSQWVFKTAQNDVVVLENMITYAESKGWKTIGLARDASGFGEGVKEMLDELGGSRGIKVVAVEKFAPDATDFTAQMVKLRNAKADANIIWGIPPAAALAQKAYRQLNVGAPVMQSHGIGNKVFLDTAAASADGLVAPLGRLVVGDQLKADDPQKKVITDFIAAYQAEYNERPSTFAGHAYDGFSLAVDALTKVGTDKQRVRDHLEGIKGFVGVSGVFTMSPQDHSGLTKEALVLTTVQGGQFRLLEG